MKKLLILSLILSLVHFACKNRGEQPDETEVPVTPDPDATGVVAPADLIAAGATKSDVQVMVDEFERMGCVIDGDLDRSCKARWLYTNERQPANANNIKNSIVVTCQKPGQGSRTFTINVYNNTPGDLLCDLIDNKRKRMILYSVNETTEYCQNTGWPAYKKEQGFTCSDDPEPVQAGGQTAAGEPAPLNVAEVRGRTITNKATDVVVTVALGGNSVTLALDECLEVSAANFDSLSLTTDNGNDVRESETASADYAVERRREGFAWSQVRYRLMPADPPAVSCKAL